MTEPPVTMKYNPAFLSEQDLRATFVARRDEFELVLETLRDDIEGASQHQLILGPRGSGKSTLVQRVAAELRSDPELSARYIPVVFGEESYEVDSAGSLWLEALDHLTRQAGASHLREAHEQLRLERDRDRLRRLCLAELDKFADARGRRLVLFVENMQSLLGEQIGPDEAWTLRHTLLDDRRIVLVATATTRFAAIDAPDQAMYELFRVVPLAPLAATECATVWTHLTGQSADERQGRALEILTGGNLRLLRILASFGTSESLSSTLEKLTRLIDEHTEFFRSNIESLPPGERRVFAALADHWAPTTASELAELLRADPNLVSAQLARLEQRGVVSSSGSPRRKCYQLTERLYNIYYLLRRHGRAAERVQVVIDFIAAYYTPDALVDRLLGFAEHALHAPSDQARELYLQAFYRLYNRLADTHASAILSRLPAGFLEQQDLPPGLRDDLTRRADALRSFKEQFDSYGRQIRDTLTFIDVVQRNFPETPCLVSVLTRVAAASDGESAKQLQITDDEARELPREFELIRAVILRTCAELLEQDTVSRLDLLCIAAVAWLAGTPALSRRAFSLLTADVADNPYVQLLSRVLAWAAGDLTLVQLAARCRLIVRKHPEYLFLPLAAGLLLLGVGVKQGALDLLRRASLMSRIVPVAAALASIHQDVCDEEPNLVLEPGARPLLPLLRGDTWEPAFTLLAFVADSIAGRKEDALEVLRLGRTVAPDNFRLQAEVAWLLHNRLHRFDESRELLREAAMRAGHDWRDRLLLALLLVDPRRDLAAALPVFLDSWRSFLATRKTPGDTGTHASLWLAPVRWRLSGHRVLVWFPAALNLPLEVAETQLAGPLTSQDLQRAVMSMCMRGEARRLLDRLRTHASFPGQEIVAAGVAMFLGESPAVPHEVAEVARDIAFDLRWAQALHEIVTGAEPTIEPPPTPPKPRQQSRRHGRRQGAPRPA